MMKEELTISLASGNIEDIEVVQSCFNNDYIEIWQGDDLIEFELRATANLIEAIQLARRHAVAGRNATYFDDHKIDELPID